MKILLNGATGGTNFGDFLFAKMFQEQVAEMVGMENTYWYQSPLTYSEFFEKRLGNSQKYKLKDMHALVCISGGYFCGNDRNWKDYIIRYLNYFSVCLRCISKGIPYGIFGVEVGISKSKRLQAVQEKVLKHAQIVTVRNSASYACAKKLGVKNLMCTADTVFAMENSLFADIQLEEAFAENGKKILLHINKKKLNGPIKTKVVPVINSFLEKHPQYSVVIAPDQLDEEQDEAMESIAQMLNCDRIIKSRYEDPLKLCKVIDAVDMVITTKLHVGIVGAKLGKSVISFSGHTEKIRRLYEELGVPERTMALDALNEETGLAMLERFYNIPMEIPQSVVDSAKNNMESVSAFITQISGR